LHRPERAATGRDDGDADRGPRRFEDIAFSPNGHTLAAATSDGTVWLLDSDTWTVRRSLAHAARVRRVAFTADGRTLATIMAGSEVSPLAGTISIWDVTGGSLLLSERRLGMGMALAIAFSADGRFLAVGSGMYDALVLLGGAPTTVEEAERTCGATLVNAALQPLSLDRMAALSARFPSPPPDPALAAYWRALGEARRAMRGPETARKPGTSPWLPVAEWVAAHPTHPQRTSAERDLAELQRSARTGSDE
jgi:hypothetical protein